MCQACAGHLLGGHREKRVTVLCAPRPGKHTHTHPGTAVTARASARLEAFALGCFLPGSFPFRRPIHSTWLSSVFLSPKHILKISIMLQPRYAIGFRKFLVHTGHKSKPFLCISYLSHKRRRCRSLQLTLCLECGEIVGWSRGRPRCSLKGQVP